MSCLFNKVTNGWLTNTFQQTEKWFDMVKHGSKNLLVSKVGEDGKTLFENIIYKCFKNVFWFGKSK